MSLLVDIRKSYGAFSLEAAFETDGDILGLLGASGCGKSVTLKCIAGIEKPDAGRIVLNGRVLFDAEKKVSLPPQERHVGYLFQQYALFPTMTVEQNVAAGARRLPRAERKEAVDAICFSSPSPETASQTVSMLLRSDMPAWPLAAQWMLRAIERHALPLIPFLAPKAAAAFQKEYAAHYKPWDRLPVQQEVFKALKRRAGEG